MDIVVAVLCNLIAALILVGGILSTFRSGLRVSGFRLLFTILSGLGAFLLTPVISNALLGIELTVEESTLTIASVIGASSISLYSINSVLYLLVFLLFYLLGTIICSIIKHCAIKAMRDKKANKARIKRAKSINPKAEKAAKKTEFKEMKTAYNASLRVWRRILSGFLGAISAIIVGFIVLIPIGFIFKDMVAANGDKAFLTDGYHYTLNGIIEDNIDFDFDGWLVGVKEEVDEPADDDAEVPDDETPDAGEEGGELVEPETPVVDPETPEVDGGDIE